MECLSTCLSLLKFGSVLKRFSQTFCIMTYQLITRSFFYPVHFPAHVHVEDCLWFFFPVTLEILLGNCFFLQLLDVRSVSFSCAETCIGTSILLSRSFIINPIIREMSSPLCHHFFCNCYLHIIDWVWCLYMFHVLFLLQVFVDNIDFLKELEWAS